VSQTCKEQIVNSTHGHALPGWLILYGWVTVWVSEQSRYVSSHVGQLSLVIPPWVDAMRSSSWAYL